MTGMFKRNASILHNRINGNSIDEVIIEGKPLYERELPVIEQIFNKKKWLCISLLPKDDPVLVPVVKANPRDHIRMLNIKLRDLAKETNFAAFTWYPDDISDIIHVSIRTNENRPDAAQAAEHMGSLGIGGGGRDGAGSARFLNQEAFDENLVQITLEERAAVELARRQRAKYMPNVMMEQLGPEPVRKRGKA